MQLRRRVASTLVISGAVIFGPAAHAAATPLTTQTRAPILTTVVIEGSTPYDAARLFATYRDQLGRPITRENARAIVEQLLALYEADGYLPPEIALDDSLTGRGVLRARLFEAQVAEVLFEGDAGRYEAALRRIGARLEMARPLRRNDVPDALRAMRQNAGLAITASTRRTEVRNAFRLVVRSEFSATDGVVRMNNRGTEQVGPGFVLGQVFANGMLGRQDKIGLIFASATDPQEYFGAGLYADVGVGDAGTHVSSLLFRSKSAPNEAPVNRDDVYRRDKMTLRLTQPLVRAGASSLNLGFAFDADDLTIDRDGVAIREDRLRVIETSLRGWRSAGATQYSGALQLRQGVDGFGAGLQTPALLVDPRREDFLLAQLNGTVYRRFATRWSTRLDAFAQYTNYVLPDTERFKIGGDRLGRGFEVAEIAGDRGVGAKVELRRDLLSSEGFMGRLSTYGFYDFGAAWKRDRPGRDSATTAGAGFALQGSSLTGYLELAAPLTGADVEGKRRASVFAELSWRF
ncbi:MAG TPA: ShlB/FhaC/HecB family hemolysin secretion/activation protein [Steroidobacteraceae bacterium]|nr:ShlB/FhaC/HecB family hemolysin secretion/activation protein [Steroidobacteraceae bacterium]